MSGNLRHITGNMAVLRDISAQDVACGIKAQLR